MIRFGILFILNIATAIIIGYLRRNEGKKWIALAAFYSVYLNTVFAVTYKYTHYVRKEMDFIPVCIVWCSGLLCSIIFFGRIWTKERNDLKWITQGSIANWISFFLVEMVLVSTQKQDYQYVPIWAACLINAAIFTGLILAHKNRLYDKHRNLSYGDIAVLFVLVVIYEYLDSVIYQSENSFIALFLEFGVILLLFLCSFSINFTSIIYSVLNLIWILTHFFVREFRSPFIPGDVRSAGTAFDVLSQYSLFTNAGIWRLMFVSLIVILIASYGPRISLDMKRSSKILIGGAGIVLVSTIMTCWYRSDFIERNNLYWEEFGVGTIDNVYKRVGPTLGFVEVMKKSRIEKPDGYSRKNVSDIAAGYLNENTETGEITPNIIVIMNESFADLSDLGNMDAYIAYDPLSYLHSFVNDGKRVTVGRTLVSTFGGNTSKSEYEFLTGNTMALTPNSNPYMTDINNDIYSLVSVLEDQGYHSYATHPCTATNWNRNKVYGFMGFDEMTFEEAYEGADRIREWITDAEVYDKINDVICTKDKGVPVFVFGVTVQNHGGYLPCELGDDELGVYLALASESDTEIERLIGYIDEYDEPTVLLFFGDHYPRLNEETFASITNASLFDSETELEQIKNRTPYLVYANYDIDMSVFTPVTSLNYLGADLLRACGLKTNAYQNYIFDMHKTIPAMNAFGYVDSQNEYRKYDELNKAERNLLHDYYILDYDSIYGDANSTLFEVH